MNNKKFNNENAFGYEALDDREFVTERNKALNNTEAYNNHMRKINVAHWVSGVLIGFVLGISVVAIWQQVAKYKTFKNGITTSIVTSSNTSSSVVDIESVKDSLIVHYENLSVAKQEMIDDLANVLWEEYDYDLPQFDGYMLDNIKEEEIAIDSIRTILFK